MRQLSAKARINKDKAIELQRKKDLIAISLIVINYLGGGTESVCSQYLKSAVTTVDPLEPLIKGNFLDFAIHYSFTVFSKVSRKYLGMQL